jgi:photosystem II stability/assembly factor-like uncharacterized protein
MLAAVLLLGCGASHRRRPIAARSSTPSACPDNLFSEALVSAAVGYVAASGGSPSCPGVVLESRDGGRTFTRRASPPDAVKIVFTTVQDGWDFGSPGGSLYHTRNGAKSWQRQSMPGRVDALGARAATVIALLDQCDDRLCRQSLQISHNNGATWTRHALEGSTTAGEDVKEQVLLTDPVRGYVLVGPRTWVTADGGRTWHPIHHPCGGGGGNFTGPLLAGTTSSTLWLVCALEPGVGNQGKLLYRSSDGGRNWRQVPGRADVFFNLRTPLPDGGYADRLAVSDTNHAYLAEQRGTLLQTSNGGRKWHDAPLPANRDAGLGDTGPNDVQFLDSRHGWTITWPGAVYRTADAGRHWAVTDPLG